MFARKLKFFWVRRWPTLLALTLVFGASLLGPNVSGITLSAEELVTGGPVDASEVKVVTPVYRPNPFSFRPQLGTYTYEASWEGIPAAQMKIQVAQNGLYYSIVTSAQTYSGIDLLYKLRYRAEGIISSVDYQPLKTTIDHKENSRIKNVEINFSEDGLIYGKREQKGKDTTEFRFKTNNFTLDPFAAAFIARGVDWKLGETHEFDTFNGKSRYLIQLTAVDKTTIRVNGSEREVWVISPVVKNLTDMAKSNKLRQAKIYVTADREREVLKLTSSVFIGSVATKLISFEPDLISSQASAQLAALKGRVVLK